MNKEVDKLISNAPLISVITVVYNSVSTIEETIMSVINQTYSNIEYIVIDGGSTDGTVDIIRKYHEHISYWVSEPDKGIYDAMNKGLQVVTGYWTSFLNSGDRFFSVNSVALVIKNGELGENCADVLYGDIVCQYDFGFLLLKPASLECFNSFFPISHPATFSRTELLQKRLFDTSFKISADFKLFHSLYFDRYRFKYIPVPIAFFDAVSGVSSTNVFSLYKENQQVLESSEITIKLKMLIFKIRFAMSRLKGYLIPNSLKMIHKKERLLRNKRFFEINIINDDKGFSEYILL